MKRIILRLRGRTQTEMDSFRIHKQVVSDYCDYIASFINIADETIRSVVDEALAKGRLWPEPLIQFNPSYQTTGDIGKLVDREKFHPLLGDIFREKKLYQHQLEAWRLGAAGSDFVVTSGTGSGKSLTYIGTIFEHLFKNPHPGIRTNLVTTKTTVLLFRCRNVIAERKGTHKIVAEEMLMWGYRGSPSQKDFLTRDEAKNLVDTARASSDLTAEARSSFLQNELTQLPSLKDEFDKVAEERSQHLVEAHERFSQFMDQKQFQVVYPVLPMDVLGIYVLLPDNTRP